MCTCLIVCEREYPKNGVSEAVCGVCVCRNNSEKVWAV